jgi:hypothetical protein
MRKLSAEVESQAHLITLSILEDGVTNGALKYVRGPITDARSPKGLHHPRFAVHPSMERSVDEIVEASLFTATSAGAPLAIDLVAFDAEGAKIGIEESRDAV